MPIKWPDLPPTIAKAISLGFFIGCAALEITNFMTLYGLRYEHCIKGYELSEEVGYHVLLMSALLVADSVYIVLILAAMPFRTCNFGADLSVKGPRAKHIFFILLILLISFICIICFSFVSNSIKKSIAYNIMAGVICQASIVPMAPKIWCGNKAFPLIKNSILGTSSTAAILHFANAGLSLAFISKSERHLSILRSGDY